MTTDARRSTVNGETNDTHKAPPLVDRLVHIADLHFWRVVFNPFRLLNKRVLGNINVYLRRRHEFRMNEGAELARVVASTGIKTILFTGDFTSTALAEEFELAAGFMERLHQKGHDAIVLPGNHDVYTFESRRRKRFEQYFGGYIPKGGYPARAKLSGGTPVVLAPTVCPNLFSSKGLIRDEEIKQTAALVNEVDGPVIVAGHYPLLEKTYGYRLTPGRRLRNAAALRRALGETERTILYACGHVHRFSYVHDEEYPNIRHLSTGALFRHNRKEEITGEFAEIWVHPGDFSVFRHTLGDNWRRLEEQPR